MSEAAGPHSIAFKPAQDRTNCVSRSWGAAFSLEFSHKMVLETCPCESRLHRRAAQNRGRALRPCYDDLGRVSCCTLGGPSDI